MLTPGMGDYGLGLAIGGAAANPYFGHGGVNEGFESTMTAYYKDGEGAVVMTSAQGGLRLTEEVMRSIAAAYHWPDFQPKVRAAVTVDPKSFPTAFDAEIEFFKDDQGNVSYMMLRQNGHETKGMKK